MNVRLVVGRERWTLQPWRKPQWAGPNRVLDADEQRELIHLYRTRQDTAGRLGRRFGVSTRTVFRYLGTHPQQTTYEAAARRVQVEGRRAGIELSRDDAIRLAIAALSEPHTHRGPRGKR